MTDIPVVPDPTPAGPTDPELPTNPVPTDPTAPDPQPGVFDPGSVPDPPVAT